MDDIFICYCALIGPSEIILHRGPELTTCVIVHVEKLLNIYCLGKLKA